MANKVISFLRQSNIFFKAKDLSETVDGQAAHALAVEINGTGAVNNASLGESASVTLTTAAKRVLGATSGAGTAATTNSTRDRLIRLGNNGTTALFYATATADDASNAHVTALAALPLSAGGAVEVFVPAGNDLFWIRETGSAGAYAEEILL